MRNLRGRLKDYDPFGLSDAKRREQEARAAQSVANEAQRNANRPRVDYAKIVNSLPQSDMAGTLFATPTAIPLPLVTANEIVAQLKKAGLSVTNVQSVKAPNATWQATQQFQISIQSDNQTGTFTILSYSTAAQAGQDAFRANLSKDYKTWGMTQVSNLLILWPSETRLTLSKQVGDKLKDFLIRPYRMKLFGNPPY